MRQIVALASIAVLAAIVLSGCIFVPGDRGGRGYNGESERRYGGRDRGGARM